MDFVFMLQGNPSNALLFGEPIFELDWFYLGKEVLYYDAHYKKEVCIRVYQVEIDSQYYVFGAALLSEETEEMLFYRIK